MIVIALLGHLPQIYENFIYTKSCKWLFIETLFLIAQNWSEPKCPLIGEYIKKLIHSYYEILLQKKKKKGINYPCNYWNELQGHYAVLGWGGGVVGTAFKDHILYNFIYITFSKWQNYRAEKQISVCLWLEMVRETGESRWNSTRVISLRRVFEVTNSAVSGLWW